MHQSILPSAAASGCNNSSPACRRTTVASSPLTWRAGLFSLVAAVALVSTLNVLIQKHTMVVMCPSVVLRQSSNKSNNVNDDDDMAHQSDEDTVPMPGQDNRSETTADVDLAATSLENHAAESQNQAESDSSGDNAEDPEQQPWVALCSIMSHNDLYVDDWTDYHLALGFEHIFIYDTHPNNTLATWYKDRQDAEAKEQARAKRGKKRAKTNQPVETATLTTHRIHVTHRLHPEEEHIQEHVYAECLDDLRALAHPPKWVMILDGDEYLVFRDMDRYPDVVTFLNEHLQSGSLLINWVVMGSANEMHDRDEPVTHRFRLAIADRGKYAETKAVAVLDHVDGWMVHNSIDKAGYSTTGMGGIKPCPNYCHGWIPNGDVSVAAVFHYKYMSYDEFNYKQCVRGNNWVYTPVCPSEVEVGEVWDDAGWQATKRLLPRYANLE